MIIDENEKDRRRWTPWGRRNWERLPLKLRKKWWRETDYNSRPASEELIAECNAALERLVAGDRE